MIELETLHQNTIVVLTLKRLLTDAFTPEGLLQLQGIVERLNADACVRALVVTGDGSEFFSADADPNTSADGDHNMAREAAACFGAVFETLQSAHPVMIAAVNDFAMGGGPECAFACDIRIARAHTKLAVPETAVGLLCCGCGTQTLLWLVGEGWAKRMILTGERVDAQTILHIGLVGEVVETGAAREAAIAMALRVTMLSPQAVTFSKQLIRQACNGVPRGAALAVERKRFVDLFDHPDQREGVNAFLEKRAPRWHSTRESETRQ